jgi:hypothetical protein
VPEQGLDLFQIASGSAIEDKDDVVALPFSFDPSGACGGYSPARVSASFPAKFPSCESLWRPTLIFTPHDLQVLKTESLERLKHPFPVNKINFGKQKS